MYATLPLLPNNERSTESTTLDLWKGDECGEKEKKRKKKVTNCQNRDYA